MSQLRDASGRPLTTGDSLFDETGKPVFQQAVGGAYFLLTNSGNKSINDNTLTAVTFDTETNDPLGLHSVSSLTSRVTITAPVAGTWVVGCSCTFATNATGVRFAYIYKNGSAYSSSGFQAPTTASTVARPTVAAPLFGLVSGDYLEMYVYQNSGGSLNVVSDFALKFWGLWLGPS